VTTLVDIGEFKYTNDSDAGSAADRDLERS